MDSPRRTRAGDPRPADQDAPAPEPRRRARLTPVGRADRLRALVLAPACSDLDVLRTWLGTAWSVTVTESRSALEKADPSTHLVLLDDRCGGPLLPLAKAVAE